MQGRTVDQLTLFLPFATVTDAVNTSFLLDLIYEFSALHAVRL